MHLSRDWKPRYLCKKNLSMKKSERENWQREMFSLIKKWQSSGMNQRDFCNRHDLSIYISLLVKKIQVGKSIQLNMLF
jgi:hypothetical protein